MKPIIITPKDASILGLIYQTNKNKRKHLIKKLSPKARNLIDVDFLKKWKNKIDDIGYEI